MCRIQRFRLVYPNGFREEREQLLPCPHGTHTQPCTHYEIVDFGDRPALAPDSRSPTQPYVVQIEPRNSENSRPRPSGRDRSRGPVEGLTLNLKFWNPFSSKKKDKKEKKQYYFVRRIKKSKPRPTVIQSEPQIPTPHTMPVVPPVSPVRGRSPTVVPIQPPPPPHHSPERRRRRRGRRTPVIILQSSEEDEESSSPPEANREHIRRTRSLSRTRYHAEKETIRLRELRQARERQERERVERIEREEREARDRAERTAFNLERRRERDERRERRQQIRQERERQRLAYEEQERRRQREARLLQEQEDRRRRREANHTRQERLRRRQEVEDAERRGADRAWRPRDEQARYHFGEQQRYARARQAHVPHYPRHPVNVHQDDDYFHRGRRFEDDDIRAANLRRFERRARPYREMDDDGWLRRRHTVGGGQRGYYGQGWRDRY